MKYKISFYDQSLSKLYLRSLEKDEGGFFDCFLFWGTKVISIPCSMDFEGTIYEMPTQAESTGSQTFYLSKDKSSFVEATSVQFGKARDFPEVEKIEVMNLSNIKTTKFAT